MKTITLNDDAYQRLLSWKSSQRDSFSGVVLRVVPKKGSLGSIVEAARELPPLTNKNMMVMEETIAWGRDPKKHRDAWTS